MATYTKQNTRVDRFQINTTFTPGTVTATAVKADAYLQTRLLVNDADATDFTEAPWRQVSFDLLDAALTNTPITAAGVTLSGYGKLAALIRQASLDRANAAGIS